MTNLIGQSLGRYHILEQLGEGGMATVYKAFDIRLEREVAIKVVRRKAFPEEKLDRILKRFEREAKALAKLNHPNIIPIIDSGEEDGTPFLVMGYIPGGTLKGHLKSKPIAWQEAVRFLAPIARALDHTHRQGIVHRDIKPSNILITEENQLMLTDFGIARVLQSEETLDLTGTGMGIGTPEYMAPEQGLGHNVDHRADIYALGIVLYEMVTGRKPFQADTPMAVVIKQVNDPLPRPTQFVPNLPKDVERILLKALAKDPKNRYQNMGEFAAALEKRANRQGKPDQKERKLVRSWRKKTTRKTVSPKMVRWITFGLVGVGLFFGASRLMDLGQMAEVFPTPTTTFTPMSTFTYTPAPSPTIQVISIPTSTSTSSPTPTKTPAQATSLQEILRNDFENGLATGFSVVYGNAKVVRDGADNQVLQIGPSDSEWPVVEFLSDLNDFVIQYRFRQIECNTNCNFNFWYRGVYRGSMSGYELLFQPQYNVLTLQYHGATHYTKAQTNFYLNPGEWYEIRIEAYGDDTTIYVDGIELLSSKTTTEISAKIAFHVDKDAAYQIDDIVVWEAVKSGQ